MVNITANTFSPKISAILYFFRGAVFLEEVVSSILSQTFQEWELVIICEPDADSQVVDAISHHAKLDSRISVHQNSKHLGFASSFNIGCAISKGIYFAMVDIASPCLPERFYEQYAFMEKNKEISVCGCSVSTCAPKRSQPFKNDDIKASLLFGNGFPPGTVMLRKSDMEEHNWRLNPNSVVEEYELWMQMLPTAKFAWLPRELVTLRSSEGYIGIANSEAYTNPVVNIRKQTLQQIYGYDFSIFDDTLFWGDRASIEDRTLSQRSNFLVDNAKLLNTLEELNSETLFFNQSSFETFIHCRWDWACKACGIRFKENITPICAPVPVSPAVSVLLPVMNSVLYLRECIDSIQAQTFTDWEMLIINEHASTDGSWEIASFYAKYDQRIRLIQNSQRLGLSESLNRGMREARGRYIARIDADDVSLPRRFEKQVTFLDTHPSIGVCGTYQQYFGDSDFVHRPATSPAQCKANLLFFCDMCHSTVMFRRQLFLDNELFYDGTYVAEDFELWSRAIGITGFANIPEILGKYRFGKHNITESKKNEMTLQSAEVVARSFKKYFALDLNDEQRRCIRHISRGCYKESFSEKDISRLQKTLSALWKANKKNCFCSKISLLRIINAHWNKSVNGGSIFWQGPVFPLNILFSGNKGYSFFELVIGVCLSSKPVTQKFQLLKSIFKTTKEKRESSARGDAVRQAVSELNLPKGKSVPVGYAKCRVPQGFEEGQLAHVQAMLADIQFRYYQSAFHDVKIRVVFWVNIPALWYVVENLYKAIDSSEKFDAIVVYRKAQNDNNDFIERTDNFFESRNISYIDDTDFFLRDVAPHVFVVQTPRDEDRPWVYSSSLLKARGIRVVYIAPGLDMGKPVNSHFFQEHFFESVWKVYTCSADKIRARGKNALRSVQIKELGLPMLDSIAAPGRRALDNGIVEKAAGRPIFLWKMQTPERVTISGASRLVTPPIREYADFLRRLEMVKDIFFIFVFLEFDPSQKPKRNIISLLEKIKRLNDNVYYADICEYSDVLLHSDAVITDCGSLLLEDMLTQKPVLYMSSMNCEELFSNSIKPLLNTLYRGRTCGDMLDFLSMYRRGGDAKKGVRAKLITTKNIFFDGRCSERIMNDISTTLRRKDI